MQILNIQEPGESQIFFQEGTIVYPSDIVVLLLMLSFPPS